MITVERTHDLATCLDIRRRVFIDEQRVSEAEEIDGLDESCEHFLARDGVTMAPLATARLRLTDGGRTAKGERLCVLAEARGRGAASMLLQAIEDRALELGAERVVGGAQVAALGLYESRGYVAEGEAFLDAGIEHRHITKSLAGRADRSR